MKALSANPSQAETKALSRAQLRKYMCGLRRRLSKAQLQQAERALANNMGLMPALRSARNVLTYAPFGGEISPAAVEQQLNCQLFQPRIVSFDQVSMRFYSTQSAKLRNSFGILEPVASGAPLAARQLDAVLVPLVAFDRSGKRLGMGAGYYDRSFAFRLQQPGCKRPKLIGLAHHFQEVDALQAESWDVPLDAILTDRELIQIS